MDIFSRLSISAVVLAVLFTPGVQASMIVGLDESRQTPGGGVAAANADRYIVTFSSGTSAARRAQIATELGVAVHINFRVINAIAIEARSTQALEALRKHPLVAAIHRDRLLTEAAKPQPPAPPTGLTGSRNPGEIQLQWIDNSDDEVGFRVERCAGASCSPATVVASTGANEAVFVDTTVADNTLYRYQVRTYVESGPQKNSAPSNIAEFAALPGAPPPPPPQPAQTGNTRQIVPIGVQRVGFPVPGTDGAGIGVAVVDSGIDFNQPDLNAVDAFNAQSPGGSAQDDRGHGTHVAGIIAALDNEIGVVGVAPASTLYAVKVLDAQGSALESVVILGLEWVLLNHDQVSPPIRVVNASFGGSPDAGETVLEAPMRAVVQQLYDSGVVVVAAAGNDASLETTQLIPAGFPEVLPVAGSVAESGANDPACGTATPRADAAAYFTSDGTGVTVSAPSEERHDIFFDGFLSCSIAINGIRSTLLIQDPAALGPDSVITGRVMAGVGEAIGTSFAAPHVAGVVARVMQMGLVPAGGDANDVEAVRNWLRENADRRDSATPTPAGLDFAPLDQPLSPYYSFDGEREGIVQAPYPAP